VHTAGRALKSTLWVQGPKRVSARRIYKGKSLSVEPSFLLVLSPQVPGGLGSRRSAGSSSGYPCSFYLDLLDLLDLLSKDIYHSVKSEKSAKNGNSDAGRNPKSLLFLSTAGVVDTADEHEGGGCSEASGRGLGGLKPCHSPLRRAIPHSWNLVLWVSPEFRVGNQVTLCFVHTDLHREELLEGKRAMSIPVGVLKGKAALRAVPEGHRNYAHLIGAGIQLEDLSQDGLRGRSILNDVILTSKVAWVHHTGFSLIAVNTLSVACDRVPGEAEAFVNCRAGTYQPHHHLLVVLTAWDFNMAFEFNTAYAYLLRCPEAWVRLEQVLRRTVRVCDPFIQINGNTVGIPKNLRGELGGRNRLTMAHLKSAKGIISTRVVDGRVVLSVENNVLPVPEQILLIFLASNRDYSLFNEGVDFAVSELALLALLAHLERASRRALALSIKATHSRTSRQGRELCN